MEMKKIKLNYEQQIHMGSPPLVPGYKSVTFKADSSMMRGAAGLYQNLLRNE